MKKRLREMMTKPVDLAVFGALGVILGAMVLLVVELIASFAQ